MMAIARKPALEVAAKIELSPGSPASPRPDELLSPWLSDSDPSSQLQILGVEPMQPTLAAAALAEEMALESKQHCSKRARPNPLGNALCIDRQECLK